MIGDPVTDKPAVMQGVYVDCKFMAGFKVARISIDIPIELSNEFLRMFGAPDRANPVHVVVARMDVEAFKAPSVPEKPAEPTVEKAKAKRSLREFPRSQQAAMLCEGNMDFRVWLTDGRVAVQELTPGYADRALKAMLAITSKRALDTDATKAAAWDALRTDFELRDLVR